MIQLELSDTEARLLQEILDDYGATTRFEVARTDSSEYRSKLKDLISTAADVSERLKREMRTKKAA